MATELENYKKASDGTMAAARLEVAKGIKENWNSLRLLDGGLPVKPSDEEFTRIGNELIDNGQSTIGGVTLTKQEIEKNSGKTLPTADDLKDVADAVGQSAAENTGSIGFLGGATVMNALMGLIQWVMGGFQGSLSESIASVSADSIKGGVNDRLTALKQKNPNSFLDADMIARTSDTVGATVMKEAGFGNGAASPSLKDVAILSVPDAVRATVKAEVHKETFDKAKTTVDATVEETIKNKTAALHKNSWVPDVVADLADNLTANKKLADGAAIKAGLAPTEAQREKFATVVADTTSDIVASGNFKDKNDLTKQINDNVVGKLKADPTLVTHGAVTFAFSDDQIKEAGKAAADGVGEKYSQIASLSKFEQLPSQPTSKFAGLVPEGAVHSSVLQNTDNSHVNDGTSVNASQGRGASTQQVFAAR